MALHYDIKNVKADWNDDAIWPITNALIWGTMSVAMNSITEKDWREFYTCLLYTSPSPRDGLLSRMPSSA